MRRYWPDGLDEVARVLDSQAGTYLDGVIRSAAGLCHTCSAPVDVPYDTCMRCAEYAREPVATADRVASQIYAVEPESQAYRLVRGYKAARVGPSLRPTMLALLTLGLRGHTVCAGRLAGIVVDGWAVVPSTRGRVALHAMVRELAKHPGQELQVTFVGARGTRTFDPAQWRADPPRQCRHAVVIDDSWVSGAHAQSVAAVLKGAGVEQVSILTVARVLRSDWPPNGSLVDRLRGGTFDWQRCPWTGDECPVAG